ncbi:MAG: VPLPA-CTERM sorting domain-containing protein [Pseudomonadota bacterium]
MKKSIFVIIAILAISEHAAALTLTVESGKVTGATGVNINGTIYNLSLTANGGCADLYFGCNNDSDFAPLTESDFAATQNALASVLQSAFDSGFVANEIAGCSDMTNCYIFTPTHAVEISSRIALAGALLDVTGVTLQLLGYGFGENVNFSNFANTTWGIFEVAAVPLPAAVWLFVSALGGLFGVRKLKARQLAPGSAVSP